MFEGLRPHHDIPVPTQETDQPRPAQQDRRYRLELAYVTGAVAVLIVWLITRVVSQSAGASFGTHVGQPYVLLGILVFGGRAVVRERLCWCRVCRRWNALEWKGERVLHRRPMRQTRRSYTVSFNVHGQKTGTSRQRSTSRVVRETIDLERVCRYCGAVRTVRDTRDR